MFGGSHITERDTTYMYEIILEPSSIPSYFFNNNNQGYNEISYNIGYDKMSS